MISELWRTEIKTAVNINDVKFGYINLKMAVIEMANEENAQENWLKEIWLESITLLRIKYKYLGASKNLVLF